MRAQILYGIGNIKYTEVDKPTPKPGQALVKVGRCGICGSDVPRIFKTGAHNMPLIPGHEFMGVVEECDERPDLIGKRVGVFPLIPCGKCARCRSGYYEMCENYNYLGSRNDGGFAEYVAAPVWNLVPVPDDVTDDEAAMLEPMCVAVHAIRRVGLIPVDFAKTISDGNAPTADSQPAIVVCGLGTIGLFFAMFLKDAGYKNILLIGNKNIQLEKALEMGFKLEQYCDVRFADPADFVMDRTDGGADYYFECIGRPESFEQAVKCTAPLGKVMLVGNPKSDMELTRDTYWKILRNQMTLTGTWNSSYPGIDEFMQGSLTTDDWSYAVNHLLSMRSTTSFRPTSLITHRLPLSDLSKGLNIMRNKSEEYLKIMIEMK